MKKLVQGIADFRKKVLPSYRETFAKLALGQSPDVLFIACSDSRVVPNLFASTDPGDLFVIRNVGNLVPPCGDDGHSSADESEAAAIEFALENLQVKDIIICGHSDCGAMHAIVKGREKVTLPNLNAWLRHGEPSLHTSQNKQEDKMWIQNPRPELYNHVSQMNVLLQIEHLKTYPLVKEKLAAGKLNVHSWWFDLQTADVYVYRDHLKNFILIDEAEAKRIIAQLEN